MKRASSLLLVSACLFLASACGKRRLEREEVDRNRIFAAILEREDRRTLGEDDFLALNLSGSPYPQVKVWCAMALGRIGDPQALPWLCEAMASPLAAVRAAAAFAAGEIEDRQARALEGRNPDAQAAARLRSLLGDSSPAVRARAAEALGKSGSGADAPAIEALLAAATDRASPEERVLAGLPITALMRLAQPSSLPLLRRLAETRDGEIRWRALQALYRLKDAASCAQFRQALSSPWPEVSAQGARGIGLCTDPALGRDLAPLLHPPGPGAGNAIPFPVRICALQALGELASRDAVPAIEKALAAPDPSPRHELFAIQAASALGSIAGADARRALARMAGREGPVALAALPALARACKETPEEFYRAADPSRFTLPEGRRAWARALGELGGERAALELKRLLVEAAEYKEANRASLIVPTVLESLAKAHPPDLEQIAATYLGSQDPVVARAAAAAYAPAAGAPNAWQPLLRAYAFFAPGPEVEVKTALLDRLEPWLGQAEVLGTLRLALRDPSRNARIAAARLLAINGDPDVPASPGPTSTRATRAVYDLCAAERVEPVAAEIATSKGSFEIQLFPEEAPLTVANFLSLARTGFYDDLSFMRVVPNFVVQGGDPRNDQEGGPGYAIRCEINMRPFERGSVGMALAGKDTGGSQFFVTLSPQPHLDGGYTCFGRVMGGMQVVENLVPGDRILGIRVVKEKALLDTRRY